MTIAFSCHACGGNVPALEASALKSLVGSDCTPVSGSLRVGVCASCGLLQKETSSAWSELCSKIYGDFKIYHQSNGQEQKARGVAGGELKPRSDLIVDFLASAGSLPEQSSVLDIGCGNGPFLRAVEKQFSKWKKTGTDLGDQFRNEIEQIGPNVSFRTSKEMEASEEIYDVVSLIHSIEHIPAPAEFLKKIKRHLKKTGLLLIQVPDADLNPFDLVVADHASHFSKTTLTEQVERAGYAIVACGNLVVSKEITLLARPAQIRPSHSASVDGAAASQIALRNLAWLAETMKSGERLAREKRPLGVFGTGIAGIWIGSIIKNSLDFYLDEDTARIGHDYFGVPIISPADVPSGATVFVCLEPNLAEAIAARHRMPGKRFVVPPPVVNQQ
jgi:2-polyprenyl-3-methyl-5-hydroxy-6-metoxy-1,4-benzoquinol methylase